MLADGVAPCRVGGFANEGPDGRSSLKSFEARAYSVCTCSKGVRMFLNVLHAAFSLYGTMLYHSMSSTLYYLENPDRPCSQPCPSSKN